eukprot:symbB.v1.2.004711.t1/scaffold273.1/size250767/11
MCSKKGFQPLRDDRWLPGFGFPHWGLLVMHLGCLGSSRCGEKVRDPFKLQISQPIRFLPMGCKGSKAQVEAPTKDSKAEVQAEATVPEKEGEVALPVAGESAPVPQFDDAAAPGTCTFCCA